MIRGQIPRKNIQFTNSLDLFSKKTLRNIKTKQSQRNTKIATSIIIKSKNAQISRKTYSNLKKFTYSKQIPSKVYSQGKKYLDKYRVFSQQAKKIPNPQYGSNFIYKPFPKRQSFVRNNNAVKYFFQSPINKQIQQFMNQDFYIDVKLSNLTMIKSFCPSEIQNNSSKEIYSPLKQRISSSRIMRDKNLKGFHERYQTVHEVKNNKIQPWEHFPVQDENTIVSLRQQK